MPETGINNVIVVGAGPAGVVLSLLLARSGISVTLLEGQDNFARDFRGDTLHASVMEMFEQLGLADQILELCHGKIDHFEMVTVDKTYQIADFTGIDTPYPYVALVPQEKLLSFLTEEAGQYNHFKLKMNARAHELIQDGDRITGVAYQQDGETHEERAALVVGADGRGSTIRREAGIKLGKSAPPMDVIWFALPRDPAAGLDRAADLRFGAGTMLVVLDRGDEWQMGYVILKGSYKELRNGGIEAFRETLNGLLPGMESTFAHLTDWKQCAILSVATGRVEQWYRPGLLLLGDAAHIMSPIGGVGINYAIHDAVAAWHVLVEPLKSGTLIEQHLQAVQARRLRATRFIQAVQSLIQRRIIKAALKSDEPFKPPLPLRFLSRFRFFRKRVAYVMAYGLDPERLPGP